MRGFAPPRQGVWGGAAGRAAVAFAYRVYPPSLTRVAPVTRMVRSLNVSIDGHRSRS